MIEEKNLIYYPKEISMIPQQMQENMNIQPPQMESPIDYDGKNEENCPGNNGRWARKEHLMFLGGCLQYGNNWKKVEAYVKTRTSTQIRSHAQKFLKKLEKKYYSRLGQNQNNSSYDNISEELNNNNSSSQNKENQNKTEEKKDENIKNNENENNPEENNINKIKDNNNNNQIFSLKNDEIATNVDNKTKLSDETIKKLVEELPKPGFNIEIVEKIILRIFRLNKKIDDYRPEINIKRNGQKANTSNSKNNKNIFLCQKLKRDINYEAQIKDLLFSNNQADLRKLFKIFEQEKDSIRYNILMKNLNDN